MAYDPRDIASNPNWRDSMVSVNADRRYGSIARKIRTAPPLHARDIESLKALLDAHPRIDSEVAR